MAGFENDIMYAVNSDYSQTDNQAPALANGLTTNGQMWIGTTVANSGGTQINVGKLTSPLGTVTIGYSSPNITLDLAGGGKAIESIGVQTGTSPIAPTAGGLVTINGAVVAAGTNPVRTDGTGANTLAVEVQTSQAIASADATKIGLSNFDSASFSVAATGFVTLAGGGAIKTITGNTGGAESPSSGNFNILGTGSITVAGTANTETVQMTGLTNHNVLIGAGTATITNVAPSATSGVPLVSQGASADPAFGTAVVAGGGTGCTTLTNHAVLVGATTTAITQLAVGATGTVLAGSTGADPSFSATPALTSVTLSGGTALSTYVEGTWTPTIDGESSSPVVTYSVQRGQYTRIGNRVVLDCNVTLASISGGSGNVQIKGLPFTINGNAQFPNGACSLDSVTFAGNYCVVSAVSNQTYCYVIKVTSAGAAAALQISGLSATSGIGFQIVYQV